MIEELVQFLVSVVNTELFERVYVKIFKSKNVEHSEEA